MKTFHFITATFLLSFSCFSQIHYKVGLNLGTAIVGISKANAQKFDLLETRSGQLVFGVDMIKEASKYQLGIGYRNFNSRFDSKPLTIAAKLTHFNNHQFHFFIDRKVSKNFMLGTGFFTTFQAQNLEKLTIKKIEPVAQGNPYPSGEYFRNYLYIKEKTPVGLLLSAKTSLFDDRLVFTFTRNQAFVSFLKNGLFMGYFDSRTRMAFSSWQISTTFNLKVK
jgi:hypothetical protein